MAAELKNPHRRKLNREAWELGRQKREDGKPRECTLKPGSRKSLVSAWLQGWDAMDESLNPSPPAPEVVHREPSVRTRQPVVQTPGSAPEGMFWPEGKDLPSAHVRRRLQPCPGCRRCLLEDGLSQAAIVAWTGQEIAGFRCRACQHRWQLPIVEV